MYTKNSCRMCLKELIGPGIDCSGINELKDAILVLFNVEILHSDTSKKICHKCFENVMHFKAFRKTVTECQKIIRDYEQIKRKIFESQSNGLSLKQEIIDLSDDPMEIINSRAEENRKPANSVTDSQINDVLDLVHDNNANINAFESSRNNSSTTDAQPSSVCRISKIESLNSEIRTTPQNEISHINGNTDIISSTSMDIREESSSANLITKSETLSNHITRSDRLCSPSAMPDVNESLISVKNESLSTVEVDYDVISDRTSISVETENLKTATTKRKRRTSSKDGRKINKLFDILPSGGRTTMVRQAKSQAIQKIIYNYPSKNTIDSQTELQKQMSNRTNKEQSTCTLNNSFPISNTPDLIKELETGNNIKLPDKRRTITVTLIKTKDNISFRYYDQFRQIIDFNSVTKIELNDIKASLMIPEIMTNLINVFKISPPDSDTFKQLKAIFGENFQLENI